MKHQSDPSNEKYNAIFTYAPLGLAEILENGEIVKLNIYGQAFLEPICEVFKVDITNIFNILDRFYIGFSEKIRENQQVAEQIVHNDLHSFRLPLPHDQTERFIQFSVTRLFENCIIVAFEDLTSKRQEEEAMHQVSLDSAVAEGKFEIASEVLHDIGNAVVGFGSYLTRLSRSMERSNVANLENVAAYLKKQQATLSTALGEEKTIALLELMDGIAKVEKENHEETSRSIVEQLNIISHIQEILTIQRQYVIGHGAPERKSVNLKEIVKDCQSMLFASYDRKGIALSFKSTEQSPTVKGDRTKLMQVILNLLKNSIEAIDLDAAQKKINIDLTLENDILQLMIKDTGKGFDPMTSGNLFERGFTTKKSGTGLGLYNCKSIIESHAGVIDIQSEGPGMGATTLIKFTR